MTEVFCGLAEMDSALMEEDKVVYLLASLPELFDVLVAALEACSEVPKMDVVAEKSLHEERKLSDHAGINCTLDEKALATKGRYPKKKGPCHHCGKTGHYKRECWKLADKRGGLQKEHKGGKEEINLMTQQGNSTNDVEALIVGHALSNGSTGIWVLTRGQLLTCAPPKSCLQTTVSSKSLER